MELERLGEWAGKLLQHSVEDLGPLWSLKEEKKLRNAGQFIGGNPGEAE